MTKDEALKIALEALKRATNYDPVIARAITAIKEALAQPEQELADIPYILADKVREALDRQACPDAFMRIAYESIIKNYTTPPQRKPLTPDQAFAIADQHPVGGFDPDIMVFIRAIEAAHGIKE